MIIDQYQKKYDFINILKIFSKFKIFLLSSINDHDVKDNLVLTYEEENVPKKSIRKKDKLANFIKYIYYEELFDFKSFTKKIFENKLMEKIESQEKDENENNKQNKI